MARTALLERLTVQELENALRFDSIGTVPVGGYPREWYEEELFRRNTQGGLGR
ncbi:MAG: hypothetical protein BWY15_00459 [Firmicutes bacterium ADurb.Bin193]|nr:MAG: hypothetical protein BWY15_00459 [Firmicutes bacterium ADurb.Bin193]